MPSDSDRLAEAYDRMTAREQDDKADYRERLPPWTLPHSVRVGPLVYSIRYTRQFPKPDSPGRQWGEVDHEFCQITIYRNLSPQQQWLTLIHECLHAIDEQLRTSLTEHEVQALSAAWWAVMLDNKLLNPQLWVFGGVPDDAG